MIVPNGWLVRCEYANMDRFRGFVSYGAIQWDVVKRYAGHYSELNGNQDANAPTVVWTPDGGFKVADGRHRFMALLGVGYETLLVRWLEPAEAVQSG
jgi:hypothetical protein